MPRFANLKGSMNTFANNKPVLSSSERLKNKRDKTIYQAQKQHFQSKRKCGNKNVKYYDNGTIRSIQGYKLQQSLARGNVLCEDCNDRGTLCGSTTRSNFSKIEMSNNLLSEHWGGGGLIIMELLGGSDPMRQTSGFNVIQSDISGVWGGSATDISKSLIGPDGTLPPPLHNPATNTIHTPYGYVNNLIKIPRNLDGNLVVIDGSNVLFPYDNCLNLNHLSREELFPYMKLSNLKTLVKITGMIPIHILINPGPPFGDNFIYQPGKCNDMSYNLLPGNFITLLNNNYTFPVDPSVVGFPVVFSGIILSLCCIREMEIATINFGNGPPTHGGTFGVFDMYIEVFSIVDTGFLSKIVNSSPQKGNGSSGPWNWIAIGNESFEVQYSSDSTSAPLILHPPLIESIKMIQGLPNLNQTVGNTTKQSYMSCLEDGTKKINFATDNVKKNTLITGYCSGK